MSDITANYEGFVYSVYFVVGLTVIMFIIVYIKINKLVCDLYNRVCELERNNEHLKCKMARSASSIQNICDLGSDINDMAELLYRLSNRVEGLDKIINVIDIGSNGRINELERIVELNYVTGQALNIVKGSLESIIEENRELTDKKFDELNKRVNMLIDDLSQVICQSNGRIDELENKKTILDNDYALIGFERNKFERNNFGNESHYPIYLPKNTETIGKNITKQNDYEILLSLTQLKMFPNLKQIDLPNINNTIGILLDNDNNTKYRMFHITTDYLNRPYGQISEYYKQNFKFVFNCLSVLGIDLMLGEHGYDNLLK